MPDLNPSYVAGFFDGDGSVFIQRITYGYQLAVNFTQCVYSVLLLLQQQYGGTISKRVPDKLSHRIQYTLTMHGKQAEKVLADLVGHSIIKRHKLLIAIEFLKHVDRTNSKSRDIRRRLYDFFQQIKDIKYVHWRKPIERFNDQYLAGLFDAEGCICVQADGRTQISVAQLNSVDILSHIQQYLGCGRVYSDYGCWVASNTADMNAFVQRVIAHLQVKLVQCYQGLKLLSPTRPDQSTIETVYSICQDEKHVNKPIDDSTREANNDEYRYRGEIGYLTHVKGKYIHTDASGRTVFSDVLKQKFSDAKMGEKHHYYGQHFSDEHKHSIHQANVGRGNLLADAEIDEVREYVSRNKSMTQEQLAEHFRQQFGKNVTRAIISYIQLGKYRKTTEPRSLEEQVEHKQKGFYLTITQQMQDLRTAIKSINTTLTNSKLNWDQISTIQLYHKAHPEMSHTDLANHFTRVFTADADSSITLKEAGLTRNNVAAALNRQIPDWNQLETLRMDLCDALQIQAEAQGFSLMDCAQIAEEKILARHGPRDTILITPDQAVPIELEDDRVYQQETDAVDAIIHKVTGLLNSAIELVKDDTNIEPDVDDLGQEMDIPLLT